MGIRRIIQYAKRLKIRQDLPLFFSLCALVLSALAYLSSQDTKEASTKLIVKDHIYEALSLLDSQLTKPGTLTTTFESELSSEDRLKLEKVRRLIEKINILDPDNEDVRGLMFAYYMKHGELDVLKEMLFKSKGVANIFKDDSDLYLTLAVMAFNFNKTDLGFKYLEESLQQNPRNLDARHLYGLVLHDFGENQKAVDLAIEGLNMSHNDERFVVLIAHVLRESGELDKAHDFLKKAISSGIEHHTVINELGVVLSDKEDHEAALSQFEKAVSLDTENWTYHKNLSLTFKKLGNVEKSDIHRKLWIQHQEPQEGVIP